MTTHIEHLATRVSDDPLFLASALAAYARSEGDDDATLASKLKCAAETLAPLRLCRMPRSSSPAFSQDVDLIAERFKIDGDVLAEMVRRGQVLMKTQQVQAPSTGGLLMAARDRGHSSRRKKGGGTK